MPRFVRDEPARHEMCNLLGMLALSAKPGHAGLPVGHVVQYKVSLSCSCVLHSSVIQSNC